MDAAASKAAYVRSMFGRIVPRYDLVNRLMTLGQDVRWRRLAAQLVKPRGALALDVGSGTADLALELAKLGARSVIGIDFCAPMMAAAQGKLARRRGGRRVSLAAADAMALPFADRSFGCVVNGFVLRNVADLKATLIELCRVLEPGGRLACLELTHAPAQIETLFGFYFNRMVPRLGALLTGQGDAYQYFSRSLDGFPDADGLAALIAHAGFVNVSYIRLGFGTIAIHLGEKPRR
ncbi:MAG TPA: ubiquinone/menaquinone biosynthesis methyltransferase [Candidatus Binataceae bacterium]|nr:ubiquinone/menaquinone biosynthesis methyltransferase [Candidatus Binataceae bacterium]